MILVLVVLVAMTVDDIFDTSKVVFDAHGRWLLAAMADYGQEASTLAWVGGPTVEYARHGFSPVFAGVLAAMLAGSLLGAEIGGHLSTWLAGRYPHLTDQLGACGRTMRRYRRIRDRRRTGRGA